MKKIENMQLIAILAGLLGLFYFEYAVVAFSQSMKPLLSYLAPSKAYLYIFWFLGVPALMEIGLVVAIYYFLRKKRWGLRLLQAIVILIFFSSARNLGIISFLSSMGKISIICSILSVVLLNRLFSKTTKADFGIQEKKDKRPKLKKFGKVVGYAVLGIVIVEFLIFLTNYFYIYPNNRISYQRTETSRDYKTEEVYNFSLDVPGGMWFNHVSYWEDPPLIEGFRTLILENDDKSVKVGIVPNDITNIHKSFGYDNSYQLLRRIFRIARMVESLPFVPDYGIAVNEVVIGSELEGFMIHYEDKERWMKSIYIIFDKEDHKNMINLAIGAKTGNKEEDEIIRRVLGSLEIKEPQHRSAKELEALILRSDQLNNKRRYKAAITPLAEVLMQSWRVPKAHFYLAKLYIRLGELHSAKYHAELAVEFNPDFKSAQKLKKKILKKLGQ